MTADHHQRSVAAYRMQLLGFNGEELDYDQVAELCRTRSAAQVAEMLQVSPHVVDRLRRIPS
jgi:hypothetical protein